jgi:hypothetical protein
MQVISRSQNIGYLVPTVMVRHFIEDMKDGRYDGFADIGIATQKLENPALRRYYGLDENITGKLVDKVVYGSSAQGILQEGDIITSIDGHRIENDGTVEFRKHEYTAFYYYSDLHQMDENVTFDIIRDKKPMRVHVPLKTTSDALYLVKTRRYDVMPTYVIYGGYVFTPLTRNLIASTRRNRLLMNYLATKWRTKDKEEVVVLLKVLASELSRGNTDFGMWPIDKVNGETFKNFKEFYALMEKHKHDAYWILEDKDGAKVIIDTREATALQPSILKTYNIEYDRSEDLREGNGTICAPTK